jgi:hypothetical protein
MDQRVEIACATLYLSGNYAGKRGGTMKRMAKSGGIALVAAIVVLGIYQLGVHDGLYGGGNWLTGVAEASMKVHDATAAVEPRDIYYPGSEAIGPDEFRVVACGTGMPNARPKQAAACWLVELGNGDKFIFDIGLGSAERISAQQIHYDYLDKVFIGHLHADHIGDLGALWIGGVISNRQRPLRIWGRASPPRSTSSTTRPSTRSSTRRTGSPSPRSRRSMRLTDR